MGRRKEALRGEGWRRYVIGILGVKCSGKEGARDEAESGTGKITIKGQIRDA